MRRAARKGKSRASVPGVRNCGSSCINRRQETTDSSLTSSSMFLSDSLLSSVEGRIGELFSSIPVCHGGCSQHVLRYRSSSVLSPQQGNRSTQRRQQQEPCPCHYVSQEPATRATTVRRTALPFSTVSLQRLLQSLPLIPGKRGAFSWKTGDRTVASDSW